MTPKRLKKKRIKEIYKKISMSISRANMCGNTMYVFDFPNCLIPDEVINKFRKNGFTVEFCKDTGHWHFSW